MTDFDEKLNNLLSNPEVMGQIMQLASSLGGDVSSSTQQAPLTTPPAQQPQNHVSPSPDAGPFGAIDPGTLMRLLPLVQELGGQNTNTRALLLALRPYLKAERQGKVDQALQLAHLICVGKKFLMNREE